MGKRILITGGSGFIGSRLVSAWRLVGHDISVLTRQPGKVRQRWPGITAVDDLNELEGRFDWVVNLAGEGIADQRWSEERKAILRASRIALTEDLVAWAKRTHQNFEVVVSGSAIGYYGGKHGKAGEAWLDETSDNGGDFAARLCRDWEMAVQPLADHCKRLVIARTGVVLGAEGGMMKRLWLPFRMGMGGQIGDGSQYLAWIHIDDYCRAIHGLLDGQLSLSGVVNMTAPEPVTNTEFTHSLATALGRLALLPMPTPMVKLLFGEMSTLLLDGQRVAPAVLKQAGFEWQFRQIDSALGNLALERQHESHAA